MIKGMVGFEIHFSCYWFSFVCFIFIYSYCVSQKELNVELRFPEGLELFPGLIDPNRWDKRGVIKVRAMTSTRS